MARPRRSQRAAKLWPYIQNRIGLTVGGGTGAGVTHAAVTLSADLDANLLALSGQQLDLNLQAANTILCGPAAGGAAAPAFRALVAADVPGYHAPVTLGGGSDPALSLVGQVLTLADVLTPAEHTAIGNGAPHHAPVTLTVAADVLLALAGQQIDLDTQAKNLVFAGPATGVAAAPTFRALVADDVPGYHAAVTLKVGHDAALSISGQELSLADVLTPAEHTAIGNGAPHHAAVTLTIAADVLLALSGQQIDLDDQAANKVLAGTAAGPPGAPTFRLLVAADIPEHNMVSGHVYTGGAALDVFGLSAADTIARLTPSANPGAAAAILKSDAAGKLQLEVLGIGNYSLRKLVTKTGIVNGVATAVFTVTTTNEAGSTDGGVYICHFRASVSHAAGNTSTNDAVKFFEGRFARAVKADGAGTATALSAVTEVADDNLAVTTPATRTIGDIVMTVVATSNYIATVSLQIALTGLGASTGEVMGEVNVIWYGFLTPPVIAVA
jgi:hypothetical protein